MKKIIIIDTAFTLREKFNAVLAKKKLEKAKQNKDKTQRENNPKNK